MNFILQVTWIRKRDIHILTLGVSTYTSDARFTVSFILRQRSFNFCFIVIVKARIVYWGKIKPQFEHSFEIEK